MITSANDVGKIDQPDKQNNHLMHLLVRSCRNISRYTFLKVPGNREFIIWTAKRKDGSRPGDQLRISQGKSNLPHSATVDTDDRIYILDRYRSKVTLGSKIRLLYRILA